jgi:uncharacterized protein (TIGR00299 family) protein
MKVAYFDCFSGVAGDMILGALIDLGVDISVLQKELWKLPIKGYTIEVQPVTCNQISAMDVTVIVKEDQHHRRLSDIVALLDSSTLRPEVKQLSKKIFTNLATAEATVHRTSIEEVHFHEVGAIDSIIDIVGSVIGITHLGILKMYCSPLPLGHGFVTCSHGILPLPAPATVELLKGIPVYSVDRDQETVTPTGAAIIMTLADKFGEMPPIKITKIGYGSGKIKSEHPNVLRIFLGELEKRPQRTKQKEKKNRNGIFTLPVTYFFWITA